MYAVIKLNCTGFQLSLKSCPPLMSPVMDRMSASPTKAYVEPYPECGHVGDGASEEVIRVGSGHEVGP